MVVQKANPTNTLSWKLDVPQGLAVAADMETLLEILGGAITENAARHATQTVQIYAREKSQHAILSVLDDGPGIEPAKIEASCAGGVGVKTKAVRGGLAWQLPVS